MTPQYLHDLINTLTRLSHAHDEPTWFQAFTATLVYNLPESACPYTDHDSELISRNAWLAGARAARSFQRHTAAEDYDLLIHPLINLNRRYSHLLP